jgi:hypothetical protein
MARIRATHEDFTANVSKIADLVQTLSINELRAVNEIVNLRWKRLQEQELRTFNLRDKVSFVSTRGITVEGVVTKINAKSCTVSGTGRFVGHTWRCSPSILTKI